MRIAQTEEGDPLPSGYPPMRQHFISILNAEEWASQWGIRTILGERPLTARQQTRVRAEISLRATHDVYEFMSEVFAMLINRVPVPRGLLRLYMNREGVVPWSE